MWTPDARCCCSHLLPESDTADCVPSGAFDWRDVEPERVLCLKSTTHMETGIAPAVAAGDTRTFGGLAEFAHVPVPLCCDESKSLRRLELFSVPELDLRGPDSTHNMNPIVTGSSLQRFSWANWFAHGLLPLPIKLDGLLHHLLLESLLLPITVCLLFMRYLWRFHQFMFRPGHRAQNAFVTCGDHGTAVI